MDYRMKQLLKSKLVPAVLSIMLGIVIIIARRAALDLLVKIIGGLVIGSGIAFLAIYLTRPDKEAGNLAMVLVMAALAVLIGILLIGFAANIVDIFPIIMGVYLVLNGLSHLTAAFIDRENRIPVGITGMLVIAMGILIVLQPGFLVNMLMVFIGAAMIANGVMDMLVLRRVRSELV